MNFDLTEEQALLRDSARRFGQDHYSFPDWRRRVIRGESFDRSLWRRMADLGWLGLTAPEEDGGLDGTPVEVMVLMEAFGRSLSLEPFVSTCVISTLLLRAATPALRQALMAAVQGGEAVVTVADSEPGGGFDLARIATRAEPDGSGFRLQGQKDHALDGGHADWFILPVLIGDAISLFLVPAGADGLRVRSGRAMDHRVNARLEIDGVRVGADHLIGPLHGGLPLLRRAIDHGVVARLAEALGAMDAAHELTLDYLRHRRQFGQPLSAFQALQHRAVDMAIACEEARSMTYLATLSLEEPEAERERIISAAKARVSQTSLFVARQAVQLHGGIGFSDELPVGHYLKRLTMIDLAFGNAAYHLGRLSASSYSGAQQHTA